MVLPLNLDLKPSGENGEMMAALPRFSMASSPSPEISSVKRVQRAHWMQRSRSRTTYSEIGTALGKWRFSSMNRVTPGPYW